MVAAAHPLTSPDWHRVAALRPRLAAEVRISRVWSRGQRWHVLHHPERGQPCRLNPQAHAVAARLNGQLSMDALWQGLEQIATDHPGTDAPSQDELIELLHRLNQHGMLAQSTGAVAGPGLDTHTCQEAGHTAHGPLDTQAPLGKVPRTGAQATSLWAWRLPLWNPSAWLDRHAHAAQRMFSGVGLALWVGLMALMLSLWALHAPALQDHALHGLTTARSGWLSLLCYPFIKGLHEAAHALALRSQGRQVHACGLSFMMLMPVPYVDASQAHGLPHAWQRALVSAAGIMAELALASLGLALWCWSEPGLWHDLGFVVWFIACTSTLLFNGNPLQRMDGYHLMTDLLHLPSLATRSSRHWQARCLRWAGVGEASPAGPHRMDEARAAPGENAWLLAYAPLAWAYQWALWLGISLWLGALSAPLGWLIAAGAVTRLAVWPWARLARQVWQAHLLPRPHSASPAGRANHTSRTGSGVWQSAAALLAPLALLLLPWPDQSLVQGVVWAPEQALIRPEVDGQIDAVLRHDGDQVQPGDALLILRNPRLLAERERLAAQLERTLQGEFLHLGAQGGASAQAADEAAPLQARLERLDDQIRSLTLTAKTAGTLRWPQPRDLPERYLRRGEMIGHVIDGQALVVRVALPQDQAQMDKLPPPSASIRLSGSGQGVHAALLSRDSMAATRQLHSAALSDAMGGDIATDPKDEHHLQTLRPVVLMDLQVPGLSLTQPTDQALGRSPPRLGQRAWVRLDHGTAPLLWQWLRQARQQIDAAFSAR